MQRLPLEIKTRITLTLEKEDAASLALVNKEWSKAAVPALWKVIAIHDAFDKRYNEDDAEQGNESLMAVYDLDTQMLLVRRLRQCPELRSHVKILRFRGAARGSALLVFGDILDLCGPTAEQVYFDCRLNYEGSDEDESDYNWTEVFKYFRLRITNMDLFTRVKHLTFLSEDAESMDCLEGMLRLVPHVRRLDIQIPSSSSGSVAIQSWPILANVIAAELSIEGFMYNDISTFIDKCPRITHLDVSGSHRYDRILHPHPPVTVSSATGKDSIIQRVDLPALNRSTAAISLKLLQNLSTTASVREVSVTYLDSGALDVLEWSTIPLAPHVKALVAKAGGYYRDRPLCLLPIRAKFIMEHIAFFRTNLSLSRLLSWRPVVMPDAIGIEWDDESYDGILLSSYTDSSGQRTLLHFRYTENIRTDPTAGAVGNVREKSCECRRWKSLAIMGHKVIPSFVLKKIYAKMGQPMKWTEPSRGIVLPDEFWSWLGDESIDMDPECDEMEVDCEDEAEDKMDCT